MKTEVARTELQGMNDAAFIQLLRKYPYQSMWEDSEAWHYAELRLCHIQGNRYMETGNINAFFSY